MQQTAPDWTAYITQMEQVLNLELDELRRAELLLQFSRIAGMAAPLLGFPLVDRMVVAGVYNA